MKVLLTGATGLLGGALLDLLLDRGHDVCCLVRRDSAHSSRLDLERVEIRYGDASDEESVYRASQGMDALAHVAGIEFAPQVISAACRAGVERLLAISSTSAHSSYPSRSGPKLAMESVVRESGLDWTIVRPTMIYGSERDKNMHKLLRFLNRSPVFPMFGSGANLWHPVYHEDCATGALAALESSGAIHEAYDLPGAKPLNYLDLVRTAAAALDCKPRMIHVPIKPVQSALRLTETLRLPLPISSEQVMRLRENKAYSYEKGAKDLDYSPRPFYEGIALEVARLREIGLLH